MTSCRYNAQAANGASAAAPAPVMQEACRASLGFAQRFNAFALSDGALAALCRAWQSVVEVAFSKRCVDFWPSSFPVCEQVSWQPALTLLPWRSADLLPMAAALGRQHTF